MRRGRHLCLQLGLPAVVLGALVASSCGGGPPTPQANGTTTTHHATATTAPGTTTTTAVAATASSLPPVSTSGPLQLSAPIEIPFSADRVTAAESPDGAVFVAPQDPANPSPAVAWVIDGNTPAAIAEHVNTGIAALAADANNFYAATYSTVYAYDRASGNQDGQWALPPVTPANSSDDNLVAMTAAAGNVYVSITKGDVVRVYRITPATTSAPHLLVTGLGAVVGSDGSIYYVTPDHHLAALRPAGATAAGAVLAPMARHAPLRRVGETADIAYCVLYLASDASSFVTGQLLSPNGGVSMHY